MTEIFTVDKSNFIYIRERKGSYSRRGYHRVTVGITKVVRDQVQSQGGKTLRDSKKTSILHTENPFISVTS